MSKTAEVVEHINYTEPEGAGKVYGVMAEFPGPDALIAATEAAYAAGYRKMDAYAPVPVHGLAEALGMHSTKVPLVVLIGGLTGAAFGYGLQYFMTALSYVHNVGGRPVHSWPNFIVIIFESTVLFAAFSAVFGMLLMNGLPRPYHPVFNVPRFAEGAQDDRFFLCLEYSDPQFTPDSAREFLLAQNPLAVETVYA